MYLNHQLKPFTLFYPVSKILGHFNGTVHLLFKSGGALKGEVDHIT